MSFDNICWLHGQTRVYYNQSTTPLNHWPFRRHTAKRSEVSPEVNLMGWPRLKCLGPGSAHPTFLLLLPWVTRSAISVHHTSPSTRSPFGRAILIHTQVARFLPTSHNFHLLTISPNLSHLCAPRDTQPFLNAKPSARSIVHRSSSADAIPPLCDILPLRICALSVDCTDVRKSTSQKLYCE